MLPAIEAFFATTLALNFGIAATPLFTVLRDALAHREGTGVGQHHPH